MKDYIITFKSKISDAQMELIRANLSDDIKRITSQWVEIQSDDLSDILAPTLEKFESFGIEFNKLKHVFSVLGFHCASCATSAETVVFYIEGVISAAANYGTNTLSVEYLPELTHPEIFKEKLIEISYDLVIDESFDVEKEEEIRLKNQFKYLIRAAFLAVPLLILGMFFMHYTIAHYLMWLLSTPLLFYFGKDFYINSWKNLKLKKTTMDTLVAISTAAAYLFSIYSIIIKSHHVYFESAGLVVYFLLIGKYFENKAKRSAFSSVRQLLDTTTKGVRLIRNNVEAIVSPKEIVIKDIIRVLPGEKIPLDGFVISGTSAVDEHFMTGEFMPVIKNPSDEVWAGSINQEGVLEIEVTKSSEETLLAQIINKVESSLNAKAPIQRYVDKIAAVFVPLIIFSAILSYLYWSFSEHNSNVAFLSFITILVVACPCAMGLATPTALLVGVSKGANEGILIRNAEVLENSAKLTDLVLDKTGTITEGKPEVLNRFWVDDEFKSVLLSIEKKSTHPLAAAIIKDLKDENDVEITNYENFVGKGVRASYAFHTFYVGNAAFLKENNINFQEISTANSVVYFANEKKLLAYFEIGDTLKPDIEAILKQLKPINLHLVSGDNKKTVEDIAQKLGIKNYVGEVSPEGKLDYIEKLQKQGKIVGMVGDGVNDALAFTSANVSIAMSNGSDAAIEVADVTILSSNLGRIKKAINLSKSTSNTIKQNLFWAFIYNILGIPLAAGVLYYYNGYLMNPMFASAAMAFSSISVVSNSLLLKFRKI